MSSYFKLMRCISPCMLQAGSEQQLEATLAVAPPWALHLSGNGIASVLASRTTPFPAAKSGSVAVSCCSSPTSVNRHPNENSMFA